MKYCSNFGNVSRRVHRLACIVLLGMLGLMVAQGQPSGGPYGPIQQHYDVPADARQIYYVAPNGTQDASGASVDVPTTLESAFAQVVTGDAIILRGGTYRTGDLRLNQGITLQPFESERPILKGTRVAEDWEALPFGLWRIAWPTLFPDAPQDWWRRERNGALTPLYRFNNDMVFVDGRMLQAAGWEGELDENRYFIDYDSGHVYIKFDPADHLVEITAFDNALTRVTGDVHGKSSDHKGFTARGLTFTQYAYRALEIEGTDPGALSEETAHGKDVVGITLEHCALTHCSRVAAYLRGDHLTVRNCLVSDTSTEGIFILSSSDVLLERNIFQRNNVELITGYYPAAVKIFNQCYRVTCRDNLVRDHPNSSGIWYDVGNVDGVFINNWIEDSNDGFFFEISKGAICAGNVFVNCNHGIRVLNSADVRMVQNTFINSDAFIERTERSAVGDHFGWHPSTGPDVAERNGHVFLNNLLVADETFSDPLLVVRQSSVLCGELTQPQLGKLDHNVYVRQQRAGANTLIEWSPVETLDCGAEYPTLAAFREAMTGFAAHGLALDDYRGPLFAGRELKRYELQADFPAALAGLPLPEEIQALLKWDRQAVPRPGAFPVKR